MKNIIRPLLLSSFLLLNSVYANNHQDDMNIPFRYAKGQALFDLNCSSCHGQNLQGTEQGPPLLHPFYKPSHHGDGSFYRAALKGVKAHHWNFGDMPPVAGMTERKMKSIVPYVRYVQQLKNLH